MNKDFFTKPISLKNINLSKIDFKNIKNKKEIIICILILVYVIGIFVIGSILLKQRTKAKAEYEKGAVTYNSLLNSPSEEEIKEQINKTELEREKLSLIIDQVNNNEVIEIFNDFKNGAPITWESEEIVLKSDQNDFKDYDVYAVNIKSFSGTLKQVEEFLEYVENYEKLVRVDTLSFKKNQITGKMGGQLKISFYFKKLSA